MEWPHMLFHIVLVMSMFHFIDAQTAPNPPFGFTFRESLKASLSVMVVAFFSALVFMGIFSLYLRHCSYEYGSINRNPIAAAAELCRRGFNSHVIEKCPILIYSAVKDLKIGKWSLECAVCLSEFQDQDEIRLLPNCHHVFHPDCIDAWLLSHMNCPVCRARLTSDIANIALATPIPTSNTENNPPTTPEPGRGHEMEHQHQQHVVSLVCDNLNEEGGGGQSSSFAGSGAVEAEEPDTVLSKTVSPRESRITLNKFPRSHSTGHSSVEVEIEETVLGVDRYTLRLPEHVRKNILVNHGRVRGLTTSDVVLPGAWSPERAWYGSNNNNNNNNNNMERWPSLSMTRPFVSNGHWGGWGERTCWTPLRMSFYKAEGAQKPSYIPPV